MGDTCVVGGGRVRVGSLFAGIGGFDLAVEWLLRRIKRPVEIEARQLTGNTPNDHDIYLWIEKNTQGSFDPHTSELPASGVSIDPATGQIMIATLEGVMRAGPGDWIIKGVKGEFYPCKPDIFEATYEKVEP